MNFKRLNNRKKAVEFGATFALVFLILGLIFSSNNFLQNYSVLIAMGFLLLAILLPGWLIPLEKLWMKLAVIIGSVMNKVLLGIVFFLVLTPLSWLKRLFSSKPSEETYWVKEERPFEKEKMAEQF